MQRQISDGFEIVLFEVFFKVITDLLLLTKPYQRNSLFRAIQCLKWSGSEKYYSRL